MLGLTGHISLWPSIHHVTMASFVDSVKTLSLNGSVKEVNGDKIAIRNICCVGAGYVGMSPLRLVYVYGDGLCLVDQKTRRALRKSDKS